MIDKRLIDQRILEKNLTKMDFYKSIGMTATGYRQMFDKGDMKVSTLQKISEVLDLSLITLLGLSTEDETTPENKNQALAWQTKLLTCMEEKVELYAEQKVMFNEQKRLYERLVASEEEKVKLLKHKEKEIASTKAKQSASSK